jgi:hypothetical protein
MAEPPAPLAVVDSYDGLIEALRRRVADLGTSMTCVDEVAGLTSYHTGKILSGAKAVGPVSFGPLLSTLGLRVHLVADDELARVIRHRLQPRGIKGPKMLRPPDRTMRAKRDRLLAAALRRLHRQEAKASAA